MTLLIKHIDSRLFHPIEQVVKLMQGFPARWFVSGGWAMDLFLGRVTRSHFDIEIGIYRQDQQQLRMHLPDWSFEKAVEGVEDPWQTWEPGEELRLPVHQIRVRNANAEPPEFEFFLNERNETDWLSRRHTGVVRRAEEVIMTSRNAIPFLAPEIQLFYKAKYLRAKDQADFSAACSRMSIRQRDWLLEKLSEFHPESPWIDALREPAIGRVASATLGSPQSC